MNLVNCKFVSLCRSGQHHHPYGHCSGLPKVIFLTVAEAEGEGGKTSALKVEAEGEAEGLVFCIFISIWWAYSDIGFWKALVEIM